jgi:hypothetical protein
VELRFLGSRSYPTLGPKIAEGDDRLSPVEPAHRSVEAVPKKTGESMGGSRGSTSDRLAHNLSTYRRRGPGIDVGLRDRSKRGLETSASQVWSPAGTTFENLMAGSGYHPSNLLTGTKRLRRRWLKNHLHYMRESGMWHRLC